MADWTEAELAALRRAYSPTLFPLEDAAREYRGMTLMELARESLETAGASTRGLSRDEVATRALHSTSDSRRCRSVAACHRRSPRA